MAETKRKRLLMIKDRINSKRPRFVQVESWRYTRIPTNWRRPRGLDDKTRRRFKGWPASPNVGYRSPRGVRNVHPSGREEILIHNIGDLSIVNPEQQVARIGGTVGERKRLLIIDEANRRGIRILNIGKSKTVTEIDKVDTEGQVNAEGDAVDKTELNEEKEASEEK